jgi:hypothetical protein
MIKDVDGTADQLQRAIISFCCPNCLAKTVCTPRYAPWWNNKLSELRAKARRLINLAKRTGQWGTYKETLTCYNKKIGRPNITYGGGTAGRAMMFPAVPDS